MHFMDRIFHPLLLSLSSSSFLFLLQFPPFFTPIFVHPDDGDELKMARPMLIDCDSSSIQIHICWLQVECYTRRRSNNLLNAAARKQRCKHLCHVVSFVFVTFYSLLAAVWENKILTYTEDDFQQNYSFLLSFVIT